MSPAPVNADEELRHQFRIYDRAVDIVSAFQWLFTRTKELPETVRHFERFPRIELADGRTVTPDFTVLFADGRAYVFEIANIPQHDNGIEKLAKQLHAYDSLPGVPDEKGVISPVTSCDVIVLTRAGDGNDCTERLSALFDDPKHEYKPSKRAVVYQFAAEPERYVFMGIRHETNGKLTTAEAGTDFATFGDLKVKPSHFAEVKAQFAFVNDPVDPLYLATTLWVKIFPSLFGTDSFETTAAEIAAAIRDQYGVGRTSEVEAALKLLSRAGLANKNKSTKTWRVKRIAMRTRAKDVHEQIIARLKPDANDGIARQRPRPRRAARGAEMPGQELLF